MHFVSDETGEADMNEQQLFDLYMDGLHLPKEEALSLLEEYFDDLANLDVFMEDEKLMSEDEIRAVKILFEEGELKAKAEKAFAVDHYCFEAIMILIRLIDDEDELYDFFKELCDRYDQTEAVTVKQESTEKLVYNLFANFLMTAEQTKESLMIQDKLLKKSGHLSSLALSRFLISYLRLKDADGLIGFFKNYEGYLNRREDYLEIMVGLFELKAIEDADYVRSWMLKKFGHDAFDPIYYTNEGYRIISEVPGFKEWLFGTGEIVS